MIEIQDKLRKTIKNLFSEERIQLFIGYERGTLPFRNRPSFANSIEDVDKMVWDACCTNNLAVYLPGLFVPHKKDKELPVIGLAAKGCDMRSVLELVKEKQLPRENIVIVDVPCQGMVDIEKLREIAGADGLESLESGEKGFLKNGELITEDRFLAEACLTCSHPYPPGADIIIEGEKTVRGIEDFSRVSELEAKSGEERWKYFENEISKCIRCYACRQACPNCYCKVCFVDQTKPAWVERGTNLSDVMFFHIGRIFHQAGRCVGCDACVRACPMGIDLRIFTQKLVKDVQELFAYTPGLTLDELPLLCSFSKDDNQDFITEP